MTRYVANHYTGFVIPELEELIKIAAHTFRRNDARGDLCFRRHTVGRGQQLHLQVVRETHLLQQSLSIQRSADESSVLNCGSNLRRNGGDELLVARGERLPRATIGKVHNAQRLSASRRRPHDRHRQHLAAPVGRLGSKRHSLPHYDQWMLGAEHSRRDAARIIGADGQNSFLGNPERRDGLQCVGARVVNENRCDASSDRLRYLGENRRRCILERDRATEYLTNRIKKIYLFVPLGQLRRRVLDLERRLSELRDDWHQEFDVPFLWRVRRIDRTDRQPDFLGRWDASDQLRSKVGRYRLPGLVRQHVGHLNFRTRAGDDRWRRAAVAASPHGGLAVRSFS